MYKSTVQSMLFIARGYLRGQPALALSAAYTSAVREDRWDLVPTLRRLGAVYLPSPQKLEFANAVCACRRFIRDS